MTTTSALPVPDPAWLQSRGLNTLPQDLDAAGRETPSSRRWRPGTASRPCGRLGQEHAGPAWSPSRPKAGPHAGLNLLASVVRTGAAASDARQTGRGWLESHLDKLPPWAEAWGRFALGMSLLFDGGPGRHERALVRARLRCPRTSTDAAILHRDRAGVDDRRTPRGRRPHVGRDPRAAIWTDRFPRAPGGGASSGRRPGAPATLLQGQRPPMIAIDPGLFAPLLFADADSGGRLLAGDDPAAAAPSATSSSP